MQSSNYISIVSGGSGDRFIQERIQEAERYALIKLAKGNKPSRIASLRYGLGQFMVGLGRRIAGRPRRARRPIEVPGAIKLAR